jgi:peptidylprolyl isomerase
MQIPRINRVSSAHPADFPDRVQTAYTFIPRRPPHSMQRQEWMVLTVALLVLLLACGCAAPQEGGASMTPSQAQQVRLETTMGNITIELYGHMPVTAGNFASLVQKGYYDGTIFHRVIDGFMIQGGDPTGTGRGGPGYSIRDEFKPGNRNDRGTIAMANSGPNTGGSQFFINAVNNNFLDERHPVFGRVVEGMDVVDRISKVKTGAGDRPVDEVKITRAVML